MTREQAQVALDDATKALEFAEWNLRTAFEHHEKAVRARDAAQELLASKLLFRGFIERLLDGGGR